VEPLELDPDGYTGTYKLIGGRSSLDLVNTISWPGQEREHDWLAAPGNVIAWLRAVGLPAPVTIPVSDLDEVHQIRGAITGILTPVCNNEMPSTGDVEVFNRHLQRVQGQRRIDPAELKWDWKAPERVRDFFNPVVLDAADLVTENNPGRLKNCPGCGWLFEDQTRNGRRRWCDMADCGSRAKARSYYHRTKS
jgi:predicted RNA-binding Zn ribbon-like protein